MHPIERLRFVARASGAPQRLLVEETAAALATFRHDPQGLVTACRRVVSRQPTSGALLWFAARVLTAVDPGQEIPVALDELAADRSAGRAVQALPEDATVVVLGWPDELGAALPRRGDLRVRVIDVLGEAAGLVASLERADVDVDEVPVRALGPVVANADAVVLEAGAVGPGGVLAVAGAHPAAAVARHAGVPVWAVAGVGRVLPEAMWAPFVARAVPEDRWAAEDEVVPLGLVDHVVGPAGVQAPDEALRHPTCPVAPELFRGDVF